jgi:hypothetical protein
MPRIFKKKFRNYMKIGDTYVIVTAGVCAPPGGIMRCGGESGWPGARVDPPPPLRLHGPPRLPPRPLHGHLWLPAHARGRCSPLVRPTARRFQIFKQKHSALLLQLCTILSQLCYHFITILLPFYCNCVQATQHCQADRRQIWYVVTTFGD